MYGNNSGEFGSTNSSQFYKSFVPDIPFSVAQCGGVSCVYVLNGSFYASGMNSQSILGLGTNDSYVTKITKYNSSYIQVGLSTLGVPIFVLNTSGAIQITE